MTEGRPAPDTAPAPSVPDTVHGTEHRALPGTTVDRIRDGTQPAELRARGDKAVWSDLVGTAASARLHGWTFAQWAFLVGERRSHLGRQARLRRGRTELTPRQYERKIGAAWDTAGSWLDRADAPTTPADVADRIAAVRAYVADADAELTDGERDVLAYATDVAETNRTDRPALPWRRVKDGTGLGERATKGALDRLARRPGRIPPPPPRQEIPMTDPMTATTGHRPTAPGDRVRRALHAVCVAAGHGDAEAAVHAAETHAARLDPPELRALVAELALRLAAKGRSPVPRT
jgi:hypothetical protein